MHLRDWKIIFVIFVCLASSSYAQSSLPPISSPANQDDNVFNDPDMPKSMLETLQRQRLAKAKREHEEMLKRGETALKLAEQLSLSFEKNKSLTAAEIKKLNDLEKLVVRIRKDLGGSDNKAEEGIEKEDASTIKEALGFLKKATADLFIELKKTSRYSISAAAIHTSNSIIRLARFLRLR